MIGLDPFFELLFISLSEFFAPQDPFFQFLFLTLDPFFEDTFVGFGDFVGSFSSSPVTDIRNGCIQKDGLLITTDITLR